MNLNRLSIGKFRRNTIDAAPRAETGEAIVSHDEPPRRPAGRGWRVRWENLPLAKAKRETRVGVAALLSFVILVTALVLNRTGKGKDTPPGDPPPTTTASGSLLALGGPAGASSSPDGPKVSTTPTEPVPPRRESSRPRSLIGEPRDPVLLASADTPPVSPEPMPDPQPPAPTTNPDPALPSPTTPTPTPSDPKDPKPDPTAPMPAPELPGPTPPAIEPRPEPTPTPTPIPETEKENVKGPAAPAPAIEPKPEPPTLPAGDPKPADPAPVPLPMPMPEPTRPSEPASAPLGPMPVEPEPTKPLETVPTLSPTPARPDPMPRTIESSPAPAPMIEDGRPERATTPRLIDPEPAAADAPSALNRPPGALPIRNIGKRRPVDDPAATRPEPAPKIVDAPMPREEVGVRDRVEPILHTVQSGENFWTISRLYYNSGRYYKALHAANRKLVPDIRELYVGATIKVPPIEELDRALIEAPTRSPSQSAARTGGASPALRASRATGDGRAVPSRARSEVELGLPVVGASRTRDGDGDVEPPTRPIYKVRAHDTLRSIARDTLGDSHRYREILEINRDLIDDPAHLVTGQTLTLPDDATVGRRLR